MTKITQIEDRGATVAWSPTSSHPDVIAVGAKVSYSMLNIIKKVFVCVALSFEWSPLSNSLPLPFTLMTIQYRIPVVPVLRTPEGGLNYMTLILPEMEAVAALMLFNQ